MFEEAYHSSNFRYYLRKTKQKITFENLVIKMKFFERADAVFLLIDKEPEVKLFYIASSELGTPYRIRYDDELSNHKIMDFDTDKAETLVKIF